MLIYKLFKKLLVLMVNMLIPYLRRLKNNVSLLFFINAVNLVLNQILSYITGLNEIIRTPITFFKYETL